MATAAAEPLASGTEAAASPRAEALGAASPRAAAAAAASASVGGLRAVTRSGRLREKRIGRLPGYVGALHGPPQAGAGAGANAATAAGANGGGVPIVNPPERVAGYFRLNRTHEAEMFYFFYRSRTGRRTDPVVLWMTGGPGCSSEIAILYGAPIYSAAACAIGRRCSACCRLLPLAALACVLLLLLVGAPAAAARLARSKTNPPAAHTHTRTRTTPHHTSQRHQPTNQPTNQPLLQRTARTRSPRT